MQYQLIRSNRKTIAISFDQDMHIVVKAPDWVSTNEINRFVQQKSQWIEATRIRLLNARQKQKQERLQLQNGDELPFLGQKLMLTVIREDRKTGRAKLVQNQLLLWIPYEADYEFRRAVLEKWYRKKALELLPGKVACFAKTLGVRYCGISIKDQKSRWGSCSSKGNLNFNFRIMMAPEKVCDYVIWHEVCHLVYMNHSMEFWKLLEEFCPEYHDCKKWLKDNVTKLYQI